MSFLFLLCDKILILLEINISVQKKKEKDTIYITKHNI